MPETQQKNFRLSPATLEQLDRLAESYGGCTRADVIRIAVHELARARLNPAPKKNPRKSPLPP